MFPNNNRFLALKAVNTKSGRLLEDPTYSTKINLVIGLSGIWIQPKIALSSGTSQNNSNFYF